METGRRRAEIEEKSTEKEFGVTTEYYLRQPNTRSDYPYSLYKDKSLDVLIPVQVAKQLKELQESGRAIDAAVSLLEIKFPHYGGLLFKYAIWINGSPAYSGTYDGRSAGCTKLDGQPWATPEDIEKWLSEV